MEHEKLPERERERERDISLVYGLDSPVDGNDVRGRATTKLPARDVSLVYGLDWLDSMLVVDDKREFMSGLEFDLRKARKTSAMDDKGRVFYQSFTDYFPKKREKLMLEAWPAMESSLKSVGISCSLNLPRPVFANFKKLIKSITFSTTLSTRGGPDMVDKAFDLLEILTISDAPPLLAIQILDGSLQYDTIRIGINLGLGSELPLVKQVKHLDLVKSIEQSIKELEKMSQCDIFLNDRVVVALGNSQPGLKLVRFFLRGSFFSSVKPATIIQALNYFLQNGGELENAEMNILGFEPDEATMFAPLLNQNGVLVCGAFLSDIRGKELGEAWPTVQSTLEKYGISCTIYPDVGFMTISTNRDRDMIQKATEALELLSATSAVPSRALLCLTDQMKCDIIRIGYQTGGLGLKLNINKKQFAEQSKLIWACRQDLGEVMRCDIYINENNVTVIAPEPERLSLVRNLVTCCIVDRKDPASLIEEIKLEPEKKKQKVQAFNSC